MGDGVGFLLAVACAAFALGWLGEWWSKRGFVEAAKRRAERVMTRGEYHSVLSLIMSADPTPLGEEEDRVLVRWADAEARARGYGGWVEAFHEIPKKGGPA